MKIGILANSSLNDFYLEALRPILSDNKLSVELVIVDSRPQKTLLQKVVKNLKRGRGGYLAVMGLQKLFRDTSKSESTELFFNESEIPVLKTEEPYSENIITKISSYNLDILLLIGGFGIVKEPLLSLTPYGILSYHHGNMRRYRGMPPVFWELYNGEKKMGLTVQKLSANLDAGSPLVEKNVKIYPNDSLKALKARAYKKSEDMLYKAITVIADEKFKLRPISEIGDVYTLPNFRQWVLLNLKVTFRKIRYIFK